MSERKGQVAQGEKMLTEIDRVQLAVTDRQAAAQGWQQLLGAEHVRDDRVACLNALRSVYRVGRSEVEFLSPDGTGAIDRALKERGRPHLFAAGAATPDLDALVAHVEKQGTPCHLENGQAFLTYRQSGQPDLPFVLSAEAARDQVGLIERLYEVTILDADFRTMMDAVTALFALNEAHYSRITSSHFKYDGYLTLFSPDDLPRFEVIQPTAPDTTMGRFQGKLGRAFYMAFAETPHILAVEERAKEAGAGITVERPEGRKDTEMADQLWLHPPALGGMMLGVSRPTMAWRWSGRPERVLAL